LGCLRTARKRLPAGQRLPGCVVRLQASLELLFAQTPLAVFVGVSQQPVEKGLLRLLHLVSGYKAVLVRIEFAEEFSRVLSRKRNPHYDDGREKKPRQMFPHDCVSRISRPIGSS